MNLPLVEWNFSIPSHPTGHMNAPSVEAMIFFDTYDIKDVISHPSLPVSFS